MFTELKIRPFFKVLLVIAVILLFYVIIFYDEITQLSRPDEITQQQYEDIMFMYRFQCPSGVPVLKLIVNGQGYLNQKDYLYLETLCELIIESKSRKNSSI